MLWLGAYRRNRCSCDQLVEDAISFVQGFPSNRVSVSGVRVLQTTARPEFWAGGSGPGHVGGDENSFLSGSTAGLDLDRKGSRLALHRCSCWESAQQARKCDGIYGSAVALSMAGRDNGTILIFELPRYRKIYDRKATSPTSIAVLAHSSAPTPKRSRPSFGRSATGTVVSGMGCSMP